jgi:hypothetical protein
MKLTAIAYKRLALAFTLSGLPLSCLYADPASITIYERSAIYRMPSEQHKSVTPRFHDFVEIPKAFRIHVTSRGNDLVLCREMANAISFGKRIGLGLSADAAIQDISEAWDGDLPCGYASPDLRLQPTAYAVRGDDKGRPVFIMLLIDQYGRTHFTGEPKRF